MSVIKPTQNDLSVLARYSNDKLFGIHEKANEEAKIVIIDKSAYTCLNRILRLIGYGPLACTDCSMLTVANYLSDRSWTDYIGKSRTQSNYRSYVKACEFANKAFRARGHLRLLSHISSTTPIEKEVFVGKVKLELKGGATTYPIFWNPPLTTKDIRYQMTRHFRCHSPSNFQVQDNSGIVVSDIFGFTTRNDLEQNYTIQLISSRS